MSRENMEKEEFVEQIRTRIRDASSALAEARKETRMAADKECRLKRVLEIYRELLDREIGDKNQAEFLAGLKRKLDKVKSPRRWDNEANRA